jgi:hypothetical protein
MMNFSERRIHSAKILFVTRYSLFAAVLPFAVHYSLLAIRYSPPFRHSLPFLARQEPRPPMMSPTKVRSMACF